MITAGVIIANVLLLCMAGFAKAVKDKVSHHYPSSIFSKWDYNYKFWNPTMSWVNKWKGNNIQVERFWGSSRWFAWTTDAWHLFDTIYSTAYQAIIAFNFCFSSGAEWYWGLALIGAMKLLVGIVFELFYSRILIKK